MSTKRGIRAVFISLLMSAAVVLGLSTPANAEPPGIPDAATAQSDLASLTVAADGSMTGYSRDQFPTWREGADNCNARESVLKRDGTDVTVGGDCYPTGGSWTVPYDGKTVTKPSDVQIDHVVPLADAWRSGAADWTIDKREDFANDLDGPQLIASDASQNGGKGDQDPSTWKPALQSYWCRYAEMWVGSKTKWGLTVNTAEKSALTDMLGGC